MKNIFTVVIPLFNKESYIEATVKSVLNQSYRDFEVLIVNDCSTDKSLEIAKSIDDSRIKIIQHEVNKGLSASRNTGIINANSEFIVFLDADDLLKTDYLQKIDDLIVEFPLAGIFATNYEQVYEKQTAIAPKLGIATSEKNILIDDFFRVSLQQPIYCQSSICVRKSVFDKIGLYNESIKYAEDIDFNIRANLHFKLAYSSEKLVQYLMTDLSQITKNSIIDKVIPDFDSFENLTSSKPWLKKYLDVNRYMLAVVYKRQGDFKKFRVLKNGIHSNAEISGLNKKQIILMNLPRFALNFISTIKNLLLQKGFRFTSFS
jgi:glycosyltransferase involved in cell wall biosynthesis